MTEVQTEAPVGMWFTQKGAVPKPPQIIARKPPEKGGVLRQIEARKFTD